MGIDPKRMHGTVQTHTVLIFFLALAVGVIAIGFLAVLQSGIKSDDLNFVSVALTFFEVFLVFALAAGFWMVRREAIGKAEEVAREIALECAEKVAANHAKDFVTPKMIRAIIEGTEDLGGNGNISEKDADDIAQHLG